MIRHYESGGTLLDLDTAQVREYFRTQVNQACERPRNFRGQQAAAADAALEAADGSFRLNKP
jgi:hypothetical protein